ncbi:MAG: CBS domain-containing protein, partial [Desulfobacterales bacterium]|nr:CBS domain-containing protein [Desulfobacterales bacterium]
MNADFDAIGSMLAAQKLYPGAVIIFPGSQEKNLRDFFIHSMSYLFNMADPAAIDYSETSRLVIVDTRQKGRLTGVAELLKQSDLIIDIYDHHPPMPGEIRGTTDVSKPYGATTTILCELLREKKIEVTPEEATVMALGIYEDTGNFTYTSTTPADFIQAGYLVSCGASLNTIASLVVKEMKTEQVTWLNELLNEMAVHHINGIAVHLSMISSQSYITDLASIVQKIVRMENLDVFFTVVLMGTKINIIARNRIPEVDVGKLLTEFGGGGHSYAASAKVENQTLPQVELRLLELLKQQLTSIQVTKKLMSSPAITVDADRSCEDAARLMTRYNINALLAIDGDTGNYEGYITRQVVEKLQFHKLGKQPVVEYINSEAVTVAPDADLTEIEEKIIEDKQRIVPVMEDGRILGVITRTDLLDYLVEHNREIARAEKMVVNLPNTKKKFVRHLLEQRLDDRIASLLIDV